MSYKRFVQYRYFLMLNIPLNKIYKIIELAECLLNYENSQPKIQGTLRQININYQQELINPSNEEKQLRKYLDELSKEEIVEVLALMYSGRGDDTFDGLVDINEADEETSPLYISEILDKRLDLPKYLKDGLKQLNID